MLNVKATLSYKCISFVFLLLFSQISFGCDSCDKKIILNVKSLQCLKNNMHKLLSRKNKLIIFSLSKNFCSSKMEKEIHKNAEVRLPKINSKNKTKTYMILKKQLICLNEKLPENIDFNKNFEFIFHQECR